jgi:hypothetical protein
MPTVAIVPCIALASLLGLTRPAESHPLHTSLAEILYEPVQREVRISIRVFADDFSKASATYASSKTRTAEALNRARPAESPALAYTRSMFVLADATGRHLPLAYCGGKRVADLIWLCFHTSAPRGIAGFQVADRILFDLYPDQINIVQVTHGEKKVSLLFTRGEGFKRLE